jgi:hypothetical protein
MLNNKKTVGFLFGGIILSSLLVALLPRFVFPVCEPPMHCYYSYMAELALSAVAASASLAALLSKGLEAPRMLSIPVFVCGGFVIAFPSFLIGVCASPEMACHYGDLPVWNLSGGLMMLLSLAVFLISKEEAD